MSLSTRLHYLVVQTDVTGVWGLSKSKRLAVYAAGIIFDLIVIQLAFCLIPTSPIWVQNLLYYAIVVNFLSIVWQFHFYMKTDVYYIIADLFNKPNLYEEALQAFFKKQGSSLYRIDGMSVFLASLISILVFIFYSAPFFYEMVLISLKSLTLGNEKGWYIVFSGVLSLTIETFLVLLTVVLIYKKHSQKIKYFFKVPNR